jgi:hypothetical protein
MATATLKMSASTKSFLGDAGQDTIIYYGTITFSASTDTYATGGIAPLTGFGLTNLGPYGNRTPLAVWVQSNSGTGWNYQWNVGTGKLQVFASAAGSSTTADGELANSTQLGTASPSIFTDNVIFFAVVPKSIS